MINQLFVQYFTKSVGVLICLLLSACMALSSNEHRSELLVVKLLETGTHAAISDNDVTFRIYTSQADFAMDYKRIHRASLPPPPPMEVEFIANLVIGLFLGTQPTTGYAIVAKQVRTIVTVDDHWLEINVEIRQPDPGQISGQMLTSPYQLISLPRGAWKKIRFLSDNGVLLSELSIQSVQK